MSRYVIVISSYDALFSEMIKKAIHNSIKEGGAGDHSSLITSAIYGMIQDEKKALRAQIKEKREALTKEYFADASDRIADAVIGSEFFNSAGTVFAYISMPDEPDTKRIIQTALSMGKTVCVPKCYGKGVMSAIRINSYDDLQPGMLGIPEPVNCEAVIAEESIDLGIIPCVSANILGQRIGHGAGYYDRFFEKSRCTTLCLCFEELASEYIPMGGYDRMMDYVVTENGVF